MSDDAASADPARPRLKLPAGLAGCALAPAFLLPPCALTALLVWLLQGPTQDMLEASRGPDPASPPAAAVGSDRAAPTLDARLVLEAASDVAPRARARAESAATARLEAAGIPHRVSARGRRLTVDVPGPREAEARRLLGGELAPFSLLEGGE